MDCKSGIDITNINDHPIAMVYNKFIAEGKCADYTSRRGNRMITSYIKWTDTGVKSFANGKNSYFPDEKVINNSVVRAIELIGQDTLEIYPTNPPTDPPTSQFVNGFLVIVNDCNETVGVFPLTMFDRMQNGGKLTFVNWPNLKWSSCSVVFKDASISAANALMFKVYVD